MKAFVDQINNGYASLLLGDESISVTVPVDWLPVGVEEGTALNITFEVDPEATEEGKKNVCELMEQLGNNP